MLSMTCACLSVTDEAVGVKNLSVKSTVCKYMSTGYCMVISFVL